jgi:hypothetical protein
MAEIMVEPMRNIRITPRITVVVTVVHRATNVGLRAPDGVIGDEKIQQAIVVVIEPCGSDTECVGRLAANPRGRCDVAERAIPVVVIEDVSARATNEQVLLAVVIVVSDRDTKIEIEVFSAKARADSYVFK